MEDWEKRFTDLINEVHAGAESVQGEDARLAEAADPGAAETDPAIAAARPCKGTNPHNADRSAPEQNQSSDSRRPGYVKRSVFAFALAGCLVVSSVLGALLSTVLFKEEIREENGSKVVMTINYNLQTATGSELSIQEIALKNQSSVVAVSTESVVNSDIWLGQYVSQGAGSGVVYSSDGYIVTNNHVIENATSITCTFEDGTSYPATLVATDVQADVAVLKIEAEGLTPVKFSDMAGVSVGDLAIAIGNPLGTLSGTVTEGIISAMEREITIDGRQMSVLQTSAAVNPGNSGGGLFDQYGELVGMVVAKSSGSDIEGLGFVIPANKVKSVAEDLIKFGYVTGRPAAGINILDLTSVSMAMKYGVKYTGVYISEVTGDNAKAAGLQAGDMIYKIDGITVTSSSMLVGEIQKHDVGDKVSLTIVRNSELEKMLNIDLVLEDSAKVNRKNETQPLG